MTTLQKHIEYWKKSATCDMKTAKDLFKLKRYDSCLFFCHLSLEKLLKGLVVIKTKRPAPYIHNLVRLIKILQLPDLINEIISNLKTITEFNIAGRYDDVKFQFYKKCTKQYTEQYLKISHKLYLWLRKKYPKN
jgi:HEPN domain-containing protein